MRCEERFYEIYGKDPVGISFCPYRICPIGAHSDHNLGKITGLAIDKGIHIAYKPKMNGVIEMCSLQFPKRAQWHIREIGEKTGDWADYLRGATWALSNRFPLTVGLCGVIEGSLPIGGLSSSAAVILSFLDALCQVNGIKLGPSELISIAFDAEKNYVGVNVLATEEYYEAIYNMPPIAAGVFFTSFANLYSDIAIYYKKTKYVMYPAIIAAITNLVLNYVFINLYGYMAAAYTTLFSYILFAFFQGIWARKICKEHGMRKGTIYNDKYMIVLAIITTLISLSGILFYGNTVLRYCAIAFIFMVCVVVGKKVLLNKKSKKKKETQ